MTRFAVIGAVATALVATGSTAALAVPVQQGKSGFAGKKQPSHQYDFSADASKVQTKAPAKGKFRSGGSGAVADDYIVVLKSGKATQDQVSASANALTKAHNGKVGKVWSKSVRGFTATMTEADARKLADDADVAYVEQNKQVRQADVQNTWPNPETDWNLWGLDRIDQAFQQLNHQYSYPAAGSGVTVYVIDSGINSAHQEFAGNPGFKNTWTTAWTPAQLAACPGIETAADSNGHGTIVAGEIAGSTYGVAKRVPLESVRVIDCKGKTTTAQLVDGINHVTETAVKPAVVNLSIGGDASDTVDAAVRASIASGVTYSIAAGNESVDACTESPSRVQEAIVVGATDETDFRASFSNYGSCVDVFAPGVRIQSAYHANNTDAVWANGTSMSAPLVAGDAALLLQAHPAWTPAQVQAAVVKAGVSGTVHGAGPGSPTKLLRIGEPAAATAEQQFGLRARANGLVVTAESGGNQPMTANRYNKGAWEGITVVDAGGGFVGLQSSANNMFITAETAGAAPLIANRASIGAWEKFTVVNNADGSVSFKAAVNGKYVTADLNNGGKLIANRDAVGLWETFDFAGAAVTVIMAAVNGKAVSADNGGNSPLVANRLTVGQWEQFDVVDAGGYAALVAHANNNFVTTDLNNGGKLIASRTAVGAWEKFTPVTSGVFLTSFFANANSRYVTADLNNGGTLTANRTAIGDWEAFQLINWGEII